MHVNRANLIPGSDPNPVTGALQLPLRALQLQHCRQRFDYMVGKAKVVGAGNSLHFNQKTVASCGTVCIRIPSLSVQEKHRKGSPDAGAMALLWESRVIAICTRLTLLKRVSIHCL